MKRVEAELRAVGATVLREWRMMRRYPTMFLSILIWPLILPAVFVMQADGLSGRDPRALASFAANAGTTEVAGFLYVGGVMLQWLTIVLGGPGVILRHEQVRGSLEAVFLTPTSRAALLFGPGPAYLLPALTMIVVVGLTLHFGFGLTITVQTALRALAVLLISIPAMWAIGMLFATAVLRFGEIRSLIQMTRGAFQLLCGMTFPIIILPEWARALALTLPPTYMIADLRAVLLAGADLSSRASDLAILLGMAVVVSVLAVVLFYRSERRGRLTGSLGLY